MDIKKIVLIIGVIDIVLLGISLFLYLGKDRTAPVITFAENPVSYEEGMDEALLLEGVTAMDAKDGDVSGSLLVEKIAGTTGKEVIVTYVARDSANNVGKASRAFPVAGTYKDGDVLPVMGGALEGEIGTEEGCVTESETETETETMSGEESSSAEDDEGRDEADAEPDRREEARQEEPVGEPEPPAGPNPVLVMSGDVVSTKVGTAPNWGQVIGAMSDDKDDYNTLYRNLKLEGHVKLEEAGEYPVTLYTVDTDGNRSEVRNLVVRVEE